MFGFLKSDPVDDPALGRLERKRGYWRGRIALAGAGEVDLAITGGRSGPDAACIAAAHEIAAVYEGLRPAIAAELAEHRHNGLEEDDADAGRAPDSSAVWEKVRTLGVLIEQRAGASMSGRVATAIVEYRTEWDEEHTLGAVIQKATLVELNGSVLSAF